MILTVEDGCLPENVERVSFLRNIQHFLGDNAVLDWYQLEIFWKFSTTLVKKIHGCLSGCVLGVRTTENFGVLVLQMDYRIQKAIHLLQDNRLEYSINVNNTSNTVTLSVSPINIKNIQLGINPE
jgi:hypothetical protein